MPAELAERYLREGQWDDRTLGQLLNDALEQDPGRTFRIWSPTNPYRGTVGEVYQEALRVATGLRGHGLGPGDMVAFQLPNWVEAAITFYACSIIGATIVPIVHFYGPKEVGFILRQSGARALVTVSTYGKRDFLAELATVRDGLDDLEMVFVVGDIDARAPRRTCCRSSLCAPPIRQTARPPSTPRAPPSSGTPPARRPIRRESCTRTVPSGARCDS